MTVTLRLSIVASIMALALLIVILELIQVGAFRSATRPLARDGHRHSRAVRLALGARPDLRAIGIAYPPTALFGSIAFHPDRSAPLLDRDLEVVGSEPDPRSRLALLERTRQSSWRLTAPWTAPHPSGCSRACGRGVGRSARARGPHAARVRRPHVAERAGRRAVDHDRRAGPLRDGEELRRRRWAGDSRPPALRPHAVSRPDISGLAGRLGGVGVRGAKAINTVLMTLACVPLYLWARRFLSEGWSLVAAASCSSCRRSPTPRRS